MTAISAFPGLENARGGAFYLHGDEHFRKEQAVRALIDAHLTPGTEAFDLDRLRGNDVEVEDLARIIATPPMMAEWRVVVLREVEGLAASKKARELLVEIAAAPPPGLALVMSCTVPSGSKAKFYKELARVAQAVEFKALADADVPGWLMTRARQAHGVEMETTAAQALGAAIGSDLGVLAKEVEKLAGFVGEGETITMKAVDAAGIHLPTQDRWRWFDLVGERRLEEARVGLGVLFGQGESGVGLVIGLATHLLRIGVALEEGPRGLEETLPYHQKWLAKRVASQARRWTADEIDHAVAGLLDVDRLLKASPHSDVHFLESWLLGLLVYSEAA